jgi:hypothetical protein
MKRLIVFLIVICFAGALSAQTSNWWRYQIKAHGGLKVGNTVVSTGVTKTGSLLLPMDSVTTDNLTTPTVFKIWRDGVQIAPDIPAASQGNLFDYAARKFLTDTLHITAAADTMEASWAGKMVNLTSANFQNITILPNIMAVGSIVTFTKYGAGVVKITCASGVTRVSVLDSTAMNTVNQTYQIEFIRLNKPHFIGDWRD